MRGASTHSHVHKGGTNDDFEISTSRWKRERDSNVRLTMMADLKYSVEDRSLLLPWYKKRVVDPIVARLPRSLHPNTITHAGHLLNLVGLVAVLVSHPAHGGLVYLVPAITLHLYNFCDNADGAHARRTGQSSPLGELLDHGLDLLNVAYIATLSAFSLGATPLGTVAMVTCITGAAAAVYWEQAETGVFQLGLLNQVEATFVLAGVLVVDAIVGPERLGALHAGPVTLRDAITFVASAGSATAMLQSAYRVGKRRGAVLPFVTISLFGVAVMASVWSHTLAWQEATMISGMGYVFLGVRNLTLRMRGRKPLVETGVLVFAVVLLGASIAMHLGIDTRIFARGAAALGTLTLGVLSLHHARVGLREATKHTP